MIHTHTERYGAMIRHIHKFVASRKHIADASVLSAWHARELMFFTCLLGTRIIRGFMLRLRLGSAKGIVLCERNVRIYHGSYIRTGHDLNLEEGCEIVGLSKRGVVFGHRCTVGKYAIIRPTNVLIDEPGEGLKMGDNSNIGAFSYIGASGYVEIGNNVLMGPRVNLLAENHRFDKTDIPIKEQGVERSFIKIEDNCWIGAGSTILAGITIGSGSIVAAGSVVTKDVPADAIVAGVPASLVRKRSDREKQA